MPCGEATVFSVYHERLPRDLVKDSFEAFAAQGVEQCNVSDPPHEMGTKVRNTGAVLPCRTVANAVVQDRLERIPASPSTTGPPGSVDARGISRQPTWPPWPWSSFAGATRGAARFTGQGKRNANEGHPETERSLIR